MIVYISVGSQAWCPQRLRGSVALWSYINDDQILAFCLWFKILRISQCGHTATDSCNGYGTSSLRSIWCSFVFGRVCNNIYYSSGNIKINTASCISQRSKVTFTFRLVATSSNAAVANMPSRHASLIAMAEEREEVAGRFPCYHGAVSQKRSVNTRTIFFWMTLPCPWWTGHLGI